MELKYIKVEVKDFIAVVTMDRPPVNAQNTGFRNEMIQVFDSFNDRDDVRVAILTGAGNTFSAGADIKERKDSIAEPGDYWRLNRAAREYTNAIAGVTNYVNRTFSLFPLARERRPKTLLVPKVR